MLTSHLFNTVQTDVCREPRFDRNVKEDLKTAFEYLYEFKDKLNKLHPDVIYIIEKLLQNK